MSMKNRVLLQRGGRDQFGNRGDSDFIRYEPSEAQKTIDVDLAKEHKRLNELFVNSYNQDWQELFQGFSKNKIWSMLCPYGRPALSTFYSSIREHETLNSFLAYWLVANKRASMKILGLSEECISLELSKYKECGRYYVKYGEGRIFGTSST